MPVKTSQDAAFALGCPRSGVSHARLSSGEGLSTAHISLRVIRCLDAVFQKTGRGCSLSDKDHAKLPIQGMSEQLLVRLTKHDEIQGTIKHKHFRQKVFVRCKRIDR